VRRWSGCGDWPAYRDAVDRLYVHLRNRDTPLDGAVVTAPVLERLGSEGAGGFSRGRTHLCIYLRLDRGTASCELELAEGGGAPLAPGELLAVGGARRHRIAGAGHLIRFGLDLPALARMGALELRGLQAGDAEDHVVFSAVTAQPVHMPLPTGAALHGKLGWLDHRARRRRRHEDCPATRRFILQHAEPSSATAEEIARIRRHGRDSDDPGRFIIIESALTDAECAQLRAYADEHLTSVVPDSVDDLPEYQVNLTPGDLGGLLGEARLDGLLRLPQRLGGASAGPAERLNIFLRKYSPATRPYITFHADTCSCTANIALSGDEELAGGRLLALNGGRLERIDRAAGAAVVHAGDLVHGVSRVERGSRYALILFYHLRQGAAEEAAAQVA
jgi:hypothetical protein